MSDSTFRFVLGDFDEEEIDHIVNRSDPAQLAALKRRIEERERAVTPSADARPSFDPASKHPHDEGRENYARVIDAGGTQADAMAEMYRTIVSAAQRGDKRVIVDEPRIGTSE